MAGKIEDRDFPDDDQMLIHRRTGFRQFVSMTLFAHKVTTSFLVNELDVDGSIKVLPDGEPK